MAPTTRRAKRNVIVSSPPTSPLAEDDADDRDTYDSETPIASSSIVGTNVSIHAKPLNNAAPFKKAKTANHPSNAAPIRLPTAKMMSDRSRSVSKSPQKPKNGSGKTVAPVKSGNLYTMFSNQAQRQGNGVHNKKSLSSTASTPLIFKDEEIDLISDDDDEVDLKKSATNSATARISNKRSSDVMTGGNEVVSGSQKFMRKAIPSSSKGTIVPRVEEDTRPWAERFAPTNLDELGVHKKKVSDVRSWLETVFAGDMRQRILILKGAAGTGKTTTIQLLSKAIGCEVLEWRNPNGSVGSSDGFLSITSQFEEFINRGGKYGQLELLSEDGIIPSKSAPRSVDNHKRMILVEEFPDTFVRSSIALQSFRSAILQYLASNVTPMSLMHANSSSGTNDIIPLVMIVSETLLTTSTAAADSFTAHRLLGPEILQHPGVTVIEFNAVAPTLLAKALDMIVLKEARKSGRRKTPGPLVLKQLCEVGDIRSAVGSLEFLCVRGDESGDWGAKIAFTKGKKSKDTPLTRMEEQSLELVTRREASLGIFHAVGKVVYNKRDDTPRKDDAEKLPSWLEERARPRKSQVTVENLIDETGTDTSTFIAALHENYVLSCDANPSNIYDVSDIDHVNGCIDALSDSDLLCPSWDGSFNSTGFGGGFGGKGSGGDILRQDEMCFQVAVRGLLFSLPCPVKRRPPPGATAMRGPSQFNMFYPTSLKLWRAQEEIGALIDTYVSKAMNGNLSTVMRSIGTTGIASNKDTVSKWSDRSISLSDQSQTLVGVSSNETAVSVFMTGSMARQQMLLERLPYMSVIQKARNKGHHTLATREMDKVTTFHGIDGPSDEPEGVLDVGSGEMWATDAPGDAEAGGRRRKRVTMPKEVKSLEQRFADQKLVLSDDDIED